MPSTTSLYTGLSALSVNSQRLDSIGNNIANVNTTAFKSSRMLFSSQFARTLGVGTAPGAFTGGTNPSQVGLGVGVGGTQKNFSSGAISVTGRATDVAIEGDGFFIVDLAGERLYSRSGAFELNENNELVSINGGRIQGFGVDENFQVQAGELAPLTIPVGTLTLAEATNQVEFNGNLDADGEVATTGAVATSAGLYSDVLLGTPIDETFDLTVPGNTIYMADANGTSAIALEGGEPGPIITIGGIEKAGQDLGTHTFQFTTNAAGSTADATGATMGDFMNWLEATLGLTSEDGLGGGISLDPATGGLVVTSNEGTAQALDLESSDFTVSNNGTGATQPFMFSDTAEATGESVRTSFVVYDSLGAPLTIDMTMVLQSTDPNGGSTWAWVSETDDNDTLGRIVGSGTLTFDSEGRLDFVDGNALSIVRDNGADSPLDITIEFGGDEQGELSAFASSVSSLAAVSQDGSALGTLANWSVAEDGTILGSFTNGLTRELGAIALARFSNNGGLVDQGGGYFGVGPNSGEPLVGRPLDFGNGRLLGGSLELSNVDLSQEFIDMILAQTGYSAASRVITTTDELMEQLLLIGR